MLFKGLVLLVGCTLSSSVGYSLGVYLIVSEVNKDKELNLVGNYSHCGEFIMVLK